MTSSTSLSRRVGRAAALTLVAATTVAVTTTAVPAQAKACYVARTFVKDTTKGTKVWVPSNQFPMGKAWQESGPATWVTTNGDATARTKGSADTVGGGGGVKLGIVDISAKYDHQWNRSTTRTSTVTQSWSRTLQSDTTWRPRVYHSGFKFTFTQVVVIEGGPCAEIKTYRRTAILPTKRKQTLMGVETYAKRGKVKRRRV